MTYPNIAAAIDGSIWYLDDSKADALVSALSGILSGDIKAGFGAALGGPSSVEPVVLDNGVALVKLHGIMGKHTADAQSGGVSTDAFRSAVNRLAEDDGIRAIVFDVNSPGGSVHGVEQAARAIESLAQIKPVYAVANDTMASAALYAMSGATKIFAQPSSIIGSVGTKAIGLSLTKKMEKDGVDVLVVKSGEQKAVNDRYEPIDNGREQTLQAQVDFFSNQFFAAIKRNFTHLTEEQMSDLTTGKTFVGEEAVDAGLADGILSLEEVIALAGADATAAEKVESLTAEYTKLTALLEARSEEASKLQSQVETLTASLEAIQAEAADKEAAAIVDAAIAEGRISAEARERLLQVGKTVGAEALADIVAATVPAPKVPLGPDPTLIVEGAVSEEMTELERQAMAAFPSLTNRK